jgi:integrase
MRVVIELGLKLGLRREELAHAEWVDVDWHHSVYRVRSKPAWGFTVKDNEERDIPIPKDFLSDLRKWRDSAKKRQLIVGTKNDTPPTSLLRPLKDLAKAAGLNCGVCNGCKGNRGDCERWYLHKLRATYATTLLRSGVDLDTLKNYMGHSDIATTARYLRHAAAPESQKKVDSIDWYGLNDAQNGKGEAFTVN